MTRLFQAAWIVPTILALAGICQAELEVQHEWKFIDWVWESDEAKAAAVEAGTYDYTTILVTDIQPAPDGRLFVSTPRYSNNPASLSTISEESGDNGPLLAPYPDWSWHTTDDCSGFTSVIRTQLDECNRLWFVDTGKIGSEYVCPAKIIAFDLATDEVVEEIEIPDDVAYRSDGKGLLELGIIESTSDDECKSIWLYFSDIEGYAMVISDGEDVWRVENKIFEPVSEDDTINDGEMVTVDDESFFRRRGPESLVITPAGYLPEQWMLIKSLSNHTRTFAVTLEDLHNSKDGSLINYYGGIGTTVPHEPAKAWSKRTGALTASFTEKNGFACWNLKYPLTSPYVPWLTQNNTNLKYVSAVKIVIEESTDTEYIWITSTQRQKYELGTMDFDDINVALLRANFTEWISGTYCQADEYTMADSIEDKLFFYVETS